MAPTAAKYLLRVTAGPSYDTSTHQTVDVNSPRQTHIASPHCTANISVRIQNYRGLPRGSPSTSAYFSDSHHKSDQYSISFTVTPHQSTPGTSLVFGNDFDHPVRDRLPYGTGTAFHIVKSLIDPGLEGDLYADKPQLYGNALSSLNILRVGERLKNGKLGDENEEAIGAIEEGGDGEGEEWRKTRGVPAKADERKKWFLKKENLEKWEWEAGMVYQADFFNPYLDFNDFSLKLPGFSLSVVSYLGGEDYLRYVLKNKDTGDVLFVVVFSLLHKEDVEQEEAEEAKKEASGKEATKADHEEQENFEPGADDVD